MQIFAKTAEEATLKLTVFTAKIQAGFPSPADDFTEGKLDLNAYLITNPPATFFVRVTGDSMVNAGIHSGDLLIVDRSIEPVNGKIIIAVLNGDLTVKRLNIEKLPASTKVYLRAENALYKPILVQEEMDFRIWGVVTAVIHKV